MKYTNMNKKMGNFVFKVFSLLPIIFMILIVGSLIFVEFYINSVYISLSWFFMLPVLGLVISWNVARMVGEEFRSTGLVRDGNTIYDVVKTPRYYTIRLYSSFIICGSFLLVMIRFISYFFIPSNNPNIIVNILGIVASIVMGVIYFIVAMSSYEQSSYKNKKMGENKI